MSLTWDSTVRAELDLMNVELKALTDAAVIAVRNKWVAADSNIVRAIQLIGNTIANYSYHDADETLTWARQQRQTIYERSQELALATQGKANAHIKKPPSTPKGTLEQLNDVIGAVAGLIVVAGIVGAGFALYRMVR